MYVVHEIPVSLFRRFRCFVIVDCVSGEGQKNTVFNPRGSDFTQIL